MSIIVNVVQCLILILERTLREWVTRALEKFDHMPSTPWYSSFRSLVRGCLEFQPTNRIRKELIVEHDFFASGAALSPPARSTTPRSYIARAIAPYEVTQRLGHEPHQEHRWHSVSPLTQQSINQSINLFQPLYDGTRVPR